MDIECRRMAKDPRYIGVDVRLTVIYPTTLLLYLVEHFQSMWVYPKQSCTERHRAWKVKLMCNDFSHSLLPSHWDLVLSLPAVHWTWYSSTQYPAPLRPLQKLVLPRGKYRGYPEPCLTNINMIISFTDWVRFRSENRNTLPTYYWEREREGDGQTNV